MSQIIIPLFAFLFAVSILVAFHEFGHFIVARCCGVKVIRFSIGFGKPLWRFSDKKQTEYVIAAIPLGGYVKMLDEREGPVLDEHKPYAFSSKSVWKRSAIVFAGPLFNFIFAVLAYWFMFMIGTVSWVPLLGEIVPDSIAQRAGMVANQEIVAIDQVETTTWPQVMRQLMKRVGDKGVLEIKTKQGEDSTNNYFLNLEDWELKGDSADLLKSLGIVFYQPPMDPIIAEVLSGEPGDKAGILVGDRIIEINGKSIKEWKDFGDLIGKSPFQPLAITLKRGNEDITLNVTPRPQQSKTGETIGFVGLTVKPVPMPENLLRKEQFGIYDGFIAAVKKTAENIVLSFQLIGKMITGHLGLQTISGPLTIAQGAAASAHIGLQYYLGFLSLISVSLGVLNLLPIPILDGGHLLYYAIEIIRGKPVSERIQEFGFKVGMFFLLFLMIVAFYNDLVRAF